jgi:enoyl-CoA hydratase/carnithine racemase
MSETPNSDAGEILLTENRGHIRVLTINRPDRVNAISPELGDALIEAFVKANADNEVRAVVLTGVGDRAFCAGEPLLSRVRRYLYEVVLETFKPTIAALNGPAVAGGCELALACDIRIGAEHAKLGLPEAKRGKGAHFANVLLPRLVCRRARRWPKRCAWPKRSARTRRSRSGA